MIHFFSIYIFYSIHDKGDKNIFLRKKLKSSRNWYIQITKNMYIRVFTELEFSPILLKFENFVENNFNSYCISDTCYMYTFCFLTCIYSHVHCSTSTYVYVYKHLSINSSYEIAIFEACHLMQFYICLLIECKRSFCQYWSVKNSSNNNWEV